MQALTCRFWPGVIGRALPALRSFVPVPLPVAKVLGLRNIILTTAQSPIRSNRGSVCSFLPVGLLSSSDSVYLKSVSAALYCTTGTGNSDPDMDDDVSTSTVVKARGLPWSAGEAELRQFFGGVNIKKINMTKTPEGRSAGEAFVELETEEDCIKAEAYHNKYLGNRYIEVIRVSRSELEWVVRKSASAAGERMNEAIVRVRGLPYGCSREEIAQFFAGYAIERNGIVTDKEAPYLPEGESFVFFSNPSIAESALREKQKQSIGHRYIEIFRSSSNEVNKFMYGGGGMQSRGMQQRPSPYERHGGMGGGRQGRIMGAGRGPPNYRGGYQDDFMSMQQGGGGYDYGYGGGYVGGMMSGGRGRGGGWSGGGRGRGGGLGGGANSIHMRGLPFRSTESDIYDFFSPIVPSAVKILMNEEGRASGDAQATFASGEDAMEAMKKDRSTIGTRYIELFLNSGGDGAGDAAQNGGDGPSYYETTGRRGGGGGIINF